MNRRTFAALPWLGIPAVFRLAQAGTPRALPTPEQIAWHDLEIETFIHFSPSTWRDSGDRFIPASEMQPEKLDAEQWVAVAQSMGARQIVFVAKHVEGFCWWQTNTSSYGVKELAWKGGKGDVLRDLSACCRRQGMRLGVYLSPKDIVHNVAVGGRSIDPAGQAEYTRIYRQQLTEVLSRYGDIAEVWFDGSSIIEVGDILKRYAPHSIVFQSRYCSIRWVGNEEGFVPYPNWYAVPEKVARSGVATGNDGDPDGTVWLPNEVDVPLRQDWFWSPSNESTLKTLSDLVALYYRVVGYGATLLMNQTPDRTGLIPAPDAKRSADFGAEIRRRFSKPLAETAGSGERVELRLNRPTRIDHVVTMENLASGQRVRQYRIQGLAGGRWRELAAGSSIGHKKIDPIQPVELSAVRWESVEASGDPQIRRLAVYEAGAYVSEEAGRVPTYRILRRWKTEDVPQSGTTWEFDLTPYCRDAGQYEVALVGTDGSSLEIKSASLIFGATPAPEFLKRSEHVLFLNVPGADRITLRVEVRRTTPTAAGQVTLRRRA